MQRSRLTRRVETLSAAAQRLSRMVAEGGDISPEACSVCGVTPDPLLEKLAEHHPQAARVKELCSAAAERHSVPTCPGCGYDDSEQLLLALTDDELQELIQLLEFLAELDLMGDGTK